MDEINYKLNSRNPVLISHAISKLIETTRQKLEDKKDISEISEFKLLLSKCNSYDSIVSTSACQALLLLVQTKLWDTKSAIATLMACLPFTKNYAVITSICNLVTLDWTVCDKRDKYTLQVPNQHPFIPILNTVHEKRSWRFVLREMSLIMDNERERTESIEFLRPVFLYALCDPSMACSDSCKREMWQLLIRSNNVSNLQIEVLLWLCINQGDNCIDANHRVLELAELMLLRKDLEYCMMLMPLIASLTIQLLEYGCDPIENFSMIGKLSTVALLENHYSYVRNIMIALMTEIILICPAAHLFKALQICLMLDVTDISCNVTLLNALSAALLKWLTYPSLLCSDALATAKYLLIAISAKEESNNSNSINVNQILLMISYSNKHIQFYMELIHNLYSLENDILSWLENLSVAPIDLQYMSKLVLCGIFLHSCEPLVIQKTCSILVQIAKEINFFASHMLSVLLYKLTRTYDSATIKYLLLAVPELAICKENVPIIVHTLNAILNSEETLKYFAIQLYLKMLDKEPRCYRFLSTALTDILEKNRDWWYADVTCARAIKYICENRPEHGEELVPLLSQILNRCVDLKGGAATALALNSISNLCKSAVIGIYSTWQVIAPKMRKEKRTVVLESLCELLAEIPSYPYRVSDDYDKLIVDVVTQLWSYVLHQDTKIIKSAFKALRSYRLERVSLSALPQDFQSDLKVPQVSSKKSVKKTNKSEDTLQYIPGACWIQMLQKVNKNALSAAGNLLIFYIENELAGYKSRIYSWPQGEPQNFKYLPERSVIRAVGDYLRRADKSNSNDQRVIVECLRIFAYKYKKPLPNVNWDFLKETMEISDEAKEYSLSIASRHSQISSSAKQLTESFLSMYTSAQEAGQLLLNKRQIVLYSNLDELCQAIQPSSLKPFLETCLAYVIDKMSLNTANSIDLFNCIMSSYVTALKSDAIQVGNRTLLSTMLEKMLEKVDLTSKCYEKYFAAVIEMSITDIERMTLPSVWWTTTPEKLYNSIIIRTELVFKQCISTPFSWLYDLIASVEMDSKMQEHILRNIQRVQTNLRLEKTCDFVTQKDWILDFMSHITMLMETSEKEINVILLRLYCDILFVLVICLSGIDCLLSKKELVITSQDVRIRLFPQAISLLIDKHIWKSITRQIMKWLNNMRTKFILEPYTFAFQRALLLLRYELDYTFEWADYLSVKTCV